MYTVVQYCRTGNFHRQQIFEIFALVVEPRSSNLQSLIDVKFFNTWHPASIVNPSRNAAIQIVV